MTLLIFDANLVLNHGALVLGWVLFGVIHSVMAAVSFKSRVQQVTRSYFKYYRLGYSILSLLLVCGLLIYQFSLESTPAWQTPAWLKVALMGPLIAGLVIMFSTSKIYFSRLSGIQVFNNKMSRPVLEQGGLHRYVRHPLYAGTLLFIWSLLFFMPLLSHALVCGVITIYTLIGIRLEERKLIAEFGEAYRQYRRNVPGIIPFIKIKRLYVVFFKHKPKTD